MPEMAENVADDFCISRQAKVAFAQRSQQKAAFAHANDRLAVEIAPMSLPQRKWGQLIVEAGQTSTSDFERSVDDAESMLRPGGS
jgi:acetyl-CoA acetyltransferase